MKKGIKRTNNDESLRTHCFMLNENISEKLNSISFREKVPMVVIVERALMNYFNIQQIDVDFYKKDLI